MNYLDAIDSMEHSGHMPHNIARRLYNVIITAYSSKHLKSWAVCRQVWGGGVCVWGGGVDFTVFPGTWPYCSFLIDFPGPLPPLAQYATPTKKMLYNV